MDANREALTELGTYLEAKFGGDGTTQEVTRTGEQVVHVPVGDLLKIAKFLRDDASCLFKQCTDICGVDWPEREKRFDVVYNLLSFQHNLRVRLIVQVSEEDTIPSIVSVAYPVMHPVLRGNTAGQKRRPCRRAHRGGAKEILKPGAVPGETVEIRGDDFGVTGSAERPRSLIV